MPADEIRLEATKSVLAWIEEKHGNDVADWWFWECTPMPIGLPDDEQLRDGLRLATGEISPRQLGDKVHGRIAYQWRQIEKLERVGEPGCQDF